MKFRLNNILTVLVITIIFSLSQCTNPLSVDDRFLEKDYLANYAPPVLTMGTVTDFSFLVIADTHYGYTQYEFFKYIDDNKAVWGIDFVILLGDITEAGTEAQYDLAKSDMAKTTLQIYPLIGNHDIFAGGFNGYKDAFGRTVYTFTVGSHRFIFLDTANGTLGNYQRTWLESVLAQPLSGRTLIFTHFSPTNDGFQNFTEMTYPEERYYLFNLLDLHDVDYYFCGHLHKNDHKEIRGVRYKIIKNASEGLVSGTLLKVRINSGVITTTYL
jgi:3',5'-cyclic AMP phosphodiesterase CpdA